MSSLKQDPIDTETISSTNNNQTSPPKQKKTKNRYSKKNKPTKQVGSAAEESIPSSDIAEKVLGSESDVMTTKSNNIPRKTSNTANNEEKEPVKDEPLDPRDPVTLRQKLIASMRSKDENSENIFNECLEMITSNKNEETPSLVDAVLNVLQKTTSVGDSKQKKYKKTYQKSNKKGDEINVLTVAVEVRNQDYIHRLSQAGACDVYSR